MTHIVLCAAWFAACSFVCTQIFLCSGCCRSHWKQVGLLVGNFIRPLRPTWGSCPAIARRMQCLSQHIPPRVHAAVFRTIISGWCSHHQFQLRVAASNVFLFCCSGLAEDSVEHYCRYPIDVRVPKDYLLCVHPAEQALNSGMLKSGSTLKRPFEGACCFMKHTIRTTRSDT